MLPFYPLSKWLRVSPKEKVDFAYETSHFVSVMASYIHLMCVRTLVRTSYIVRWDGWPSGHSFMPFGCGLVVNSAPTRQPGLGPHNVGGSMRFAASGSSKSICTLFQKLPYVPDTYQDYYYYNGTNLFFRRRFAETGSLYPSSKPSTATSQSESFSNATTMSTVSQYKYQCGNQQNSINRYCSIDIYRSFTLHKMISYFVIRQKQT
jgi:hypothetical protein